MLKRVKENKYQVVTTCSRRIEELSWTSFNTLDFSPKVIIVCATITAS